jgi:hypothetical protein
MPRTEITRAKYRRSGLRYASDMTDAEWALIVREAFAGIVASGPPAWVVGAL